MTSHSPAIVARGACVPRLRLPSAEVRQALGHPLPRGVEALAVPAFDQDAVALAAEAARRAVRAWGGAPDAVATVLFATAGEASGASVVAEAVGAPTARAEDVTGGPTAGLAALASAFETAAAQRGPVLVVAADAPRARPGAAEDAAGAAGAAALVIAPSGEGITLEGQGSASADPVGGGGTLLASARRHLGKLPEDLAFRVTTPGGGTLRTRIGEAGAAHPLLELCHLAGDTWGDGVVETVGGGRAVALHLRIHNAPAGAAASLIGGVPVTYLRALHEGGHVDAGVPREPMGAYVSFQAFAETLSARYRLIAARCRGCGRVAYPPRAACPGCASLEVEEVPLSGECSLYAYTTIGRGGAPSEFAEQQALTGAYVMGLVEFKEGPKVAALITDAEEEELTMGMPLEPVFRRLYVQQGVARYGLKFTPLRDE